MTTNEGGTIPEEYLVLYTRDRIETASQVWLGLTANCAACHDHKFDPLTQKEVYSLAAFFNNTTQNAMDGNIKDTPGCMLMGPNGFFEMTHGVIRALRHVHMNPADADFYGVKNGEEMRLKIGGPCAVTLDKMLVRVDKSFKLEVHIDTDEGNACNLQPSTPCELLK